MKVESKNPGHSRVMAGIVVASLVLGACAASGPELGSVSGTVKMDGKPVPMAQLVFEPEGPGRASMGLTNEKGEYVMEYTAESTGAILGPVIVHISTLTTQHPETIPPQYNTKSELKREIKSGKNVFDFDLESGGWKSKVAPDSANSKPQ